MYSESVWACLDCAVSEHNPNCRYAQSVSLDRRKHTCQLQHELCNLIPLTSCTGSATTITIIRNPPKKNR